MVGKCCILETERPPRARAGSSATAQLGQETSINSEGPEGRSVCSPEGQCNNAQRKLVKKASQVKGRGSYPPPHSAF